MTRIDRNKYCARADLTNEASVEQFFLTRLIEDLGYEDAQIKPKTSLQGEQAAAIDRLTAAFELGSDEALRIIEAFKPPR